MSNQALFDLRTELKSLKIDAIVIPCNDAHNSEYVSDFDTRINFIANFSGSNATVIVTIG